MSSNQSYQYIFKLVLIGPSSVGKSSLLQRFVNGDYSDSYQCTVGVDFYMRTLTIDKKAIKLQIWDTAGMEKYRALTSSYFRGSHAAFIVFDITNRHSFDEVPKWLEMYSKNSNSDSRRNIILIGNKKDLENYRKVSADMAINFATRMNLTYMETSAKVGDNVEEVFRCIAKQLMENLGDRGKAKREEGNAGNQKNLMDSNSTFSNIIISGKEKKIKRCPCG